MVHPGKLGAWYLLMIISFALVSLVHRERGERPEVDEVDTFDGFTRGSVNQPGSTISKSESQPST